MTQNVFLWTPRSILSSLGTREPNENYVIWIEVMDLIVQRSRVLDFASNRSLLAYVLSANGTILQEGQPLPLEGTFILFNDDEASFVLGVDERNFEKLYLRWSTYLAVRKMLLRGQQAQDISYEEFDIDALFPEGLNKTPVISYYASPADVDMKIEFFSRRGLQTLQRNIQVIARDFANDSDKISVGDVNSFVQEPGTLGWILQDGGSQKLTWDLTRFLS
jgi:hypothetical protein